MGTSLNRSLNISPTLPSKSSPHSAPSISLGQSALAETLAAIELKQLTAAGTETLINAGTVLLAEGQGCDTLYVVLEGTLEVLKTEVVEGLRGKKPLSKPLSTEQLGTLKPGETVGEVGLLMPLTSPVTFQASTDCRVFALSRAAYGQLAVTHPVLGRKLATSIAKDFDHKLTMLMGHVASLLSDHESLVHTVERLQQDDTAQNSAGLQAQLQLQIQQFQQKASALKRRTYALTQERNQARSTVKNTRLLMGLMAGVGGLLLLGNIVGWSKALSSARPFAEPETRAHPTVIPYIKSESNCEKRSGSVWANGECLDYGHDPSF
ncbi:MAG: cyclic nucleotide-binding domain-containing protein [Cyanobacteria bacterium J06649_4]